MSPYLLAFPQAVYLLFEEAVNEPYLFFTKTAGCKNNPMKTNLGTNVASFLYFMT